jgi:hypothetical protein
VLGNGAGGLLPNKRLKLAGLASRELLRCLADAPPCGLDSLAPAGPPPAA